MSIPKHVGGDFYDDADEYEMWLDLLGGFEESENNEDDDEDDDYDDDDDWNDEDDSDDDGNIFL